LQNLLNNMRVVIMGAVGLLLILAFLWFKGGKVTLQEKKPLVSLTDAELRFIREKYSGVVKIYLPYYKNLNLELVLAMIGCESRGKQDETGEHGEYGSMQVKPDALADFNSYYSRQYTMNDLFNLYYGVEVGMGYLNLRFVKWKEMSKAVRAYNQGDGGADSFEAWDYFYNVENVRSQFKNME